jgi:hypothetical protein
MVQVTQGLPDPRDAHYAQFGQSLGQGISGGLNTYFANKALDEVNKDPEIQKLPLSQQFGAYQKAAAPYGEQGQKFLAQRMQYKEQEHQRGQLKGALEEVQQLVNSGGDPAEISIGAAKAFAGIPGGDKLAQHILPIMLQDAAAKRRYGNKKNTPSENKPSPYAPMGSPQGQVTGIPPAQGQQPGVMGPTQQQPQNVQPQGDLQEVIDSDYNIKTPQQMIDKAKEDAELSGDPNRYATALAEGEAENTLAKNHKDYLQSIAQSSGSISNADLPKFMLAAKGIPTNNPDQWLEQAMNRWAPIQDSYKRLSNAFIPGVDSALLGENRDEALKRIIPNSQDLVKKGQERPLRQFLTENYLTPTEVEEQIHPLDDKTKKSLDKLPKGLFPAKKLTGWKDLSKMSNVNKALDKNPFVDYDTALEKSPKAMQTMQNRLANFINETVTPDTSLSVLREELWNKKDYDWRQIGPAIEQAKEMGLKLTPTQDAELSHISTTPPYQSLPDIFKGWDRIVKLVRGNK